MKREPATTNEDTPLEEIAASSFSDDRDSGQHSGVYNPLISVARSKGGDPRGNGLVAALDPSAFGDQFLLNVERLRAAIKNLPPSFGVDDLHPAGRTRF